MRMSAPVTDGSSIEVLTLPESERSSLSVRAKAMVFADPRSQALWRELDKVAPSQASVLVLGETGTGKEIVARELHARSRRNGPFVAVNCGALVESLAESELFGHEAGSFTGAHKTRAGWFEVANGGTLFLDEIGDLPLNLQVKLLRTLQEREVVRVGGRRSIPVDVRLVSGTNIDLTKAVAAGHFRQDLYYRLNVVLLNLPPLRQRSGDIMPLVEHFLGIYSQRLLIPRPHVSADAQQALLSYAWPGNIRELENVVHYALLMCGEQEIGLEHLRFSQDENLLPPDANRDHLQSLGTSLVSAFNENDGNAWNVIEHEIVTRAYVHCRNNQVQTARMLGISRNVLRSLLARHGLLPGRDSIDADDTEEVVGL